MIAKIKGKNNEHNYNTYGKIVGLLIQLLSCVFIENKTQTESNRSLTCIRTSEER